MAIPLALMAAGTAIQIVGNYTANLARARQETANALFYREQAEFAKAAMFRELQIADREYTMRKGAQVSAAARGGADVGSGSISATISATAAQRIEELIAIKRKGTLDFRLASLRGQLAGESAKTLRSDEFNFLQAGSTLLTAGARAADSPRVFEALGGTRSTFSEE